MNADEYISGQLAAYALQQGMRHGGVANSLAVAHAMANRVKAGWFGGNWMQVLEYATDAEGNDYSHDRVPVDIKKVVVKKVLENISDIYGGLDEDVYTKGRGLYFADMSDHVKPEFVERIIRNPEDHPRVATVGPVSFFG